MDNSFFVDHDKQEESEQTKKLTKQLVKYMKKDKTFYGGEKSNEIKSTIIPLLEREWQNWVVQNGLHERQLAPATPNGIRFIEVGSTCLEKVNRRNDLDILVVIRSIFNKIEFMERFFDFLPHVGVSQLRRIISTPVPLIKFRLCEIDVDLMFASVMVNDFKEADLDQEHLIFQMDFGSILALNSHRNNMFILRMQPSTDKYSSVLRVIKIWAKNRGIYGSRLGLIGGISLAIMVAKILQEYDLGIVKTIRKFYEFYAEWDWQFPVMIHDAGAANHPPLVQGSPIARIMTTTNFLMPILTPVYPHQNTNQNITISAKRMWDTTVKEARSMCNNFDSLVDPWKLLLEPRKFFKMYNVFLYLSMASDSNQDLLSVYGFVESKIRLLINILDGEKSLSLAHINVNRFSPLKKAFIVSKDVQNPRRVVWFIGLEFNDGFRKEDLRIMYYLNKFQMILDRHWSDQQDAPRFEVKNTIDLKFATIDDLYTLIPFATINRT